MVVFEQYKKEGEVILYHYYPENERDKKPGIIELNSVTGLIELVMPAEKDRLRRVKPSDFNDMRDAINEMRIENGETELTEEVLPSATESEEWYWYADHAIRKIVRDYNEGKILKYGTVRWY